jgi:hypothetical protein
LNAVLRHLNRAFSVDFVVDVDVDVDLEVNFTFIPPPSEGARQNSLKRDDVDVSVPHSEMTPSKRFET